MSDYQCVNNNGNQMMQNHQATTANSVSDTPETDALYPNFRAGSYDAMFEHARKLERQRNELLDVMKAAVTLIEAKGRHNTMLAYVGLQAAIAKAKGETP